MTASDSKNFVIICVDDEPDVLQSVSLVVKSLGYKSISLSDPNEVLKTVIENELNLALIISDFNMPGLNGFELRKLIIDKYSYIPYVILSGFVSREMALTGINLKIAQFLEKPYSRESLVESIQTQSALRIASLKEDQELSDIFVKDCVVLLDDMETLALSLKEDPSDLDSLNRIFGVIHTIKGGSGFVKPPVLYPFLHQLEDHLSAVKQGSCPVDSNVVEIFLKSYDIIKNMLYKIEKYENCNFDSADFFLKVKELILLASQKLIKTRIEPHTKGVLVDRRIESSFKSELRIPSQTLEEFLVLSSEITVLRNMIKKISKYLEKEFSENKEIKLMGELLEQMNKINTAMQDKITELRKVPLKNIFKPLVRTVHNLSEQLNKRIRIEFENDILRVDNSIAEGLNSCLIHLIRNASDHAIESPEERVALKKNETGTISISSEEKNDSIIVEIRDDGRGIDSEKIKNKLIEKKWYNQKDIELLSEEEIFLMIFRSGFSTAAQVTDVSGRGVGMDVVKSTIDNLGGRIDIRSKVGQGTSFLFKIPLPKSVHIINSLLVQSQDQTFAIPLDQVVQHLHRFATPAVPAQHHVPARRLLEEQRKL